MSRSTQKPNDKDAGPSDPNIREWMNIILMKIQTASVRTLSFVHFVDSFTNQAQFNAGFSKRLKLKD